MRPGHFIYYCILLLANHASTVGPSAARAHQLQAVSGFEAGNQLDGSKGKTKALAKAPAKAAKGPAKDTVDQKWTCHGCSTGNILTPRQLNGLAVSICTICRTKLPQDKQLSLLKFRRGGSVVAKCVHVGLCGSMERHPKRERPLSQRHLHSTEGDTKNSGSPRIQLTGGLHLH